MNPQITPLLLGLMLVLCLVALILRNYLVTRNRLRLRQSCLRWTHRLSPRRPSPYTGRAQALPSPRRAFAKAASVNPAPHGLRASVRQGSPGPATARQRVASTRLGRQRLFLAW